jgi:hypothetical protein
MSHGPLLLSDVIGWRTQGSAPAGRSLGYRVKPLRAIGMRRLLFPNARLSKSDVGGKVTRLWRLLDAQFRGFWRDLDFLQQFQ